MIDRQTIVVFGASGFLGTQVVLALRSRDVPVCSLPAPRLLRVGSERELRSALANSNELVGSIASQIVGAKAVVNAAGNPNASLRDEGALMASNALLPAILSRAVSSARVARFVHISSAAVQGSEPRLDETTKTASFSAYSRSKELGEILVRENAGTNAVIFRPPSVHAADRRVSQMTARLARSPFASVASPSTSPSPQALLPNVADAAAFIAVTELVPRAIVMYPSEGLTTSSLLSLLGGHNPHVVPRWLAGLVVKLLAQGGKCAPIIASDSRRIEMIWFGQEQAASWLTEAGWTPPVGLLGWKTLAEALSANSCDSRARHKYGRL